MNLSLFIKNQLNYEVSGDMLLEVPEEDLARDILEDFLEDYNKSSK